MHADERLCFGDGPPPTTVDRAIARGAPSRADLAILDRELRSLMNLARKAGDTALLERLGRLRQQIESLFADGHRQPRASGRQGRKRRPGASVLRRTIPSKFDPTWLINESFRWLFRQGLLGTLVRPRLRRPGNVRTTS